jgi:hypothetical protein
MRQLPECFRLNKVILATNEGVFEGWRPDGVKKTPSREYPSPGPEQRGMILVPRVEKPGQTKNGLFSFGLRPILLSWCCKPF